MASVVREWLGLRCTLKQQTVLLSALRGCDGIGKEDVTKKFTRMLRGVILYPADPNAPNNSFMKSDPTMVDLEYFLGNLDHYPVHWLFHFGHACEIVGYKHPDAKVGLWWWEIYRRICVALHVRTESEEDCDYRLRDADK